MGRPKKWYFGVVRKLITTAYSSEETSPVIVDTKEAITKVYEALGVTEDGQVKQRIVKEILLTGRESTTSLYMKIYVSERSQMRVISNFIYQVAELLGYEENKP